MGAEEDQCQARTPRAAKEFQPGTLNAYQRRFRRALASYLDYADDPSAWKAPERPNREDGNGSATRARTRQKEEPRQVEKSAGLEMKGSNLVEYPYPLREGVMARLALPRDLKAAEVKRLTAFMTTLVIDAGGNPD